MVEGHETVLQADRIQNWFLFIFHGVMVGLLL